MTHRLLFLLLVFAAAVTVPASATTSSLSAQQRRSFEGTFTQPVRLDYLLYLPPGYADAPSTSYPMLMFLHGIGERGTDPADVRRHGPPSFLDSRPDFPFIVVSPQCPPGEWWNNNSLISLLDGVQKEYRVDPDRVYLTGLSMGGYGTWALALQYPERFAAVAPICGVGNHFLAERLKNVPIWTFHGAKDTVVEAEETDRMVDALKKAGAVEIRYTLYPDATHNSWTRTYNNPELYEWLLQHRRKPVPEVQQAPGSRLSR